ncbi:MAG: mechanosensitive ion channel [Prevotella sp.]|nr:mechanosensitive ion channel [Prevotella sp.]
MKQRLKFLLLLLLLMPLSGVAQTEPTEQQDSVQLVMDSLRREVQELKLKEMMMQHVLDSTGRSAREDSMRQALRQQQIDSLRKITPGVPVIVEGDTLFNIYASLGGEGPLHRAENIAYKVKQLGKSLRTTTDSVFVFNSELTSDIMCGEVVVMRVSELDGLWAGKSRQELARDRMATIDATIAQLQKEYGLKAKLYGLCWAVVLIVLQILFFILTSRFIAWLRREIAGGLRGRLRSLVVKGYELLNLQQVKRILFILARILQAVLVVLQLFISLPTLFIIFPETEKFTWNMIYYVWEPLRDIVVTTVHYFPNLVKIAVIIYVVRWLLKGIRHLSNEVEAGRLKLDSFYQDWAQPTYHIIRIFVIAFTLIIVWPLLPGSDSGVFKGVSIFVAALFSLGSSVSIGNLVSGIIITYMRPFLVGDFVQIGEHEGTVIEKNSFTTRLRDIKENIITVPNNSILSQTTVNYTAAVRQAGGTIVHSDFTFTYKVFREQIEPLLLQAAGRCELLLKTPPPFVLVTQLEDFYTRYQINAYTVESQRLFEVYSELHKNILDVFRENNLEPTSSHFIRMS